MRRIGTIAALCLALAAMVALGAVAGADAKTKKKHRAKVHETSQLMLQAVGPDGLSGRVSGSDKTCRAQRHVTVYRVNSGPSVPSSEFVGSTWTHGDGSWAIPGPMFPSQFFAVVEAKSAKRIVCSSSTSNALLWG
jgi:hypothetical protein